MAARAIVLKLSWVFGCNYAFKKNRVNQDKMQRSSERRMMIQNMYEKG